MDIAKSFTYVFDEENWVRKVLAAAGIVLLGVVLAILIIPAILAYLLLAGYGLEITRRVIRGESPVLPDWGDWGKLLTDGFKVWVVSFVYALPIIAFNACLGIPIGILSDEAEQIGAIFGAFSALVSFLWSIPMGLVLPAAVAHVAAEGELAAAFRLGRLAAFVRQNFGTYVVVLVLGWVATFVGGLGVILCGVGWLVTVPYAGWISSHLRGQAYVKASGPSSPPEVQESSA
ncbi:MAG: DUF4013 domain-containing protein [Anaerolineae bacterium]|jgi:hypothetical protein